MPNYYAGGSIKRDFTLAGKNFTQIPNNAVAVLATDNNNPLELRETTSAALKLTVGQKTDTVLELKMDTAHTLNEPSYLGAILSEDRQTVYWVNESKPLPN